MGYRYEETFRELQPGDVSGAVLLYGKRQPDSIVAAVRASEPGAARLRGPALRQALGHQGLHRTFSVTVGVHAGFPQLGHLQ